MNAIAKLDREDERRRFLDALIVKRVPGSKIDMRDVPLVAHCQCDNRRRWLLEALPHAVLEKYIQQLDAVGEKLVWSHFREKIASVPDNVAVVADAPKSTDVAVAPEPTEAVAIATPLAPSKKSKKHRKHRDAETVAPIPVTEAVAAAEVVETVEPARPLEEDTHTGGPVGAEMEVEVQVFQFHILFQVKCFQQPNH